MATKKPRLSVTLRPELYSIIAEIASIRRVSMSSVVSEYLDAASPVLERTVVILAAVDAKIKAAQSGLDSDMEAYRNSLEEAEKALAPMLASALGELDGIEPPPSNTGVTPSSSVDSPETSTPLKPLCGAASSGVKGNDV